MTHHWFSGNNNLPASVVDTILFNPLGSAAMYAMLFTLMPKINPQYHSNEHELQIQLIIAYLLSVAVVFLLCFFLMCISTLTKLAVFLAYICMYGYLLLQPEFCFTALW